MTPTPLSHADPSRPDERLTADAAAHMARYPALQLVAELLTRLREMSFPWWTAEQLRNAYPATERMHWLTERSDLRQRITTQLTGLAPRAARNKSPEFQAELIDSVIDEGDISLEGFENAFEPADLAVYGPAGDYFRLFRKRMPWDDDATPHQDLVGWLIGAFLADKSSLDGSPRVPILSAVQVRTAIDGRVWHSRIPLHVRVAIDDARFSAMRDRPSEPYGVERDLAIATPALIAASIPLKDLLPVFDVAAQALGFDESSVPQTRAHARESSTRSTSARAEGSDEGPGSSTRPPAHFLALPDDMPGVKESRPPPPPAITPPAPVIVPPPASVPFAEEAAADDAAAQESGERAAPAPSPIVDPDDPATLSPGASKSLFDVADPETSNDPRTRDSVPDELEHTNPWNALGDIAAQIAGELRGGKKGSGED